MITTWCGVSAIRRPSDSFAASTAFPHEMLWPDGAVGRFASSHEARLEDVPRSKVEMIMYANSPEFEEPTSVISKVRSSSTGAGLWLPCDLSWYFQVPG